MTGVASYSPQYSISILSKWVVFVIDRKLLSSRIHQSWNRMMGISIDGEILGIHVTKGIYINEQ